MLDLDQIWREKKKAGEKRLRQEAATLALPSPRADLAGVVKGRRRKPRAHLGWGETVAAGSALLG